MCGKRGMLVEPGLNRRRSVRCRPPRRLWGGSAEHAANEHRGEGQKKDCKDDQREEYSASAAGQPARFGDDDFVFLFRHVATLSADEAERIGIRVVPVPIQAGPMAPITLLKVDGPDRVVRS